MDNRYLRNMHEYRITCPEHRGSATASYHGGSNPPLATHIKENGNE